MILDFGLSFKRTVSKYASIHQALSAFLAGEITWNSPEARGALQSVFHYLFADTANKQHFMSQVNDGLLIVKQVGLAPPTGGHLLMYVVWLKETMHLYNQTWTKSRQLITQVEDERTRLHEMSQIQNGLARSIVDSKRQAQELATQVDSIQTGLQYMMNKMERLQRATTALNMLPQNGEGSIISCLQEFHRSELTPPEAMSRQLPPLKTDAVFPPEIMIAIQENAPESFWRTWRSAERSMRESIQWTASERENHRQICKKLSYCQEYFDQELPYFPEMNFKLERIQLERYIPTPQDTASFNQLVSRIENNLKNVDEIRTKPPRLMSGFFRKQEEQQALKLFQETRELLVAANGSRDSIPRYVRESNVTLLAHIALELSSSLQWLVDQQAKTRDDHEAVMRKKERLETEREQIQRRCVEDESQLNEAKKTFETSIQRLTSIFQELSKCASIPEALCKIAQQYANSTANALLSIEEYRIVSQHWVNDIQRLETMINELWGKLQVANERVQQRFTQLYEVLKQQRIRLNELGNEQETLEGTLQHDPLALLTERQWWSNFWETIPNYLRPLLPPEGIFALPLLEAVEKQFKAWASELAREEYMVQRYDRLIADWVTHLHTLSEDETRELQEMYIQNANVIGITCGQAPKLTLREWRAFDTVIIDEVSKATAPELLLPAIKGKKLILIGDHRQLPPMIEDKTLVQMAEEAGQDSQAYRFLNRSYFKERYDEAPETIKRMLSIQYRMHPDIMAAINQFYEHPLECGLNQPDIERDHQFESILVRKNKHLIWVTTPLVSMQTQKQPSQTILVKNRTSGREAFRYQSAYHSFGEEADRTSQINRREVEIIENICEELQHIWALKRAEGAEPKEIGVITFYAAQEKLLRDHLISRHGKSSRFDALNIRVGTVDRFQGMERAVIIVSMVRNNSQRDIGFARKDERINVAFSRAQQLLIIVGCHDLFCGTARYEEAVERYNNVSKIVKKRGDFIDVSCL